MTTLISQDNTPVLNNLLFLENNKSARIWAFDEMIDENTNNDGNDSRKCLNEIKEIIDYVISKYTNMPNSETLNILNTYKSYLYDKIIIFSILINIDDIDDMNGKYYLCGWTGHAIIIFINKQNDNKYEFGIINCGEGADIQGCNNCSCNGIIVLKNIEKHKILTFLIYYKNFLSNSYRFDGKNIYKSFYLMLFNKILDMNFINFSEIDDRYISKFYKLPLQNIGSCIFTNTISIVYHIYIKNYKNKLNISSIFEKYLIWYNKIKHIIKRKMYYEIINTNNKTYYNIYKYILDTTRSNSIIENITYNTYNTAIQQQTHNYTLNNESTTNVYLNKYILLNTDHDYYWDIYTNKTNIETLARSYISYTPENQNILITNLFDFCYNIVLFDNNMKLLIPLLILYNLKREITKSGAPFNIDINTLNNSLKYYYGQNYKNRYFITHTKIIYICIYALLIKNQNSCDECYYDKSDPDYNITRDMNFKHYNYTVFQYIPIINNYFYEIIEALIKELYENIEILPDINNPAYIISNKYLVISTEANTKFLLKYHLLFNNVIFSLIMLNMEIIPYTSNNINFLLWYIFVHNKNDLSTDIKNDFNFDFEVYGYKIYPNVNSEYEHSNVNFIVNTDNNSIEENPGLYKLYTRKIDLFFEKIKEQLSTYDISNTHLLLEMLKNYIVYFYLCYLQNKNITKDDSLYIKYNDNIIKNIKNIYHGPFINIINMYICKYNIVCPYDKNLFVIDNKTLIPNMEKKFFTLKEYEYEKKDNLYISIIQFYVIKTIDYNLLFYSENNTKESINIIIDILNEQTNFSIYLLLNFSFSRDDKYINGIHKNDSTTVIRFNENIIRYTYNEIIYFYKNFNDLPDDNYKNFYNLLSYNDNGLFLYELENIYYLRTLNYDFIFIMKNSNIYICINDIEYMVKYFNDTDNFNNYGILKLYKDDLYNAVKIICIYNYNNILKSKAPVNMNFIDNRFKSSSEEIFTSDYSIPDEYKLYYSNVLTIYNNKIILTNISEVLSLLINCLYYNSPFLILKNIEQIKIILNNNDHNKNNLNKLLNTLFLNFDNIYSLPILFLFYEKNMNNFYYKNSNIIYEKYDILLRLRINVELDVQQYIYLNIHTGMPIAPDIFDKLVFQNDTSDYQFTNSHISLSISSNIYNLNIGLFTQSRYILDNIHIPENTYFLSILLYNNPNNRIDETTFKNLINIFILSLNDSCFDNNITIATSLYKYLIEDKHTTIFPIQELLMGSGKSTVLTSYICILLLNKFFSLQNVCFEKKEKEIYIVLPAALINSSFITLMKYVFPLFNNIEVLIYPNKPLYDTLYYIYLISDLNYKMKFLNDDVDTTNKYMIYDEIDMIANPLTCELNKPNELNKLNEVNKQKLISTDDLFKLANLLYTTLYIDTESFWNNIEKYHNGIHYYIHDTSTINYNNIIRKFNDAINLSMINNPSLLTYVKENILIFILTKQFNFNYGLPEEYNLDTLNSYKFKAIPYSAVDNPILGSEFSDPILTYILTLFCYKFVKDKFRKIDKTYIVEYYNKLYETTNDMMHFNTLSNFFTITEPIFEYNYYIKNKEYYMDNYKETFTIDPENFIIILTKILNMNITYYKTCKNISFTDLLLTRHVKNFVCFTGTAYITPPKGNLEDANFDHNNPITNYMINDQNIENTVKDIILNPKIIPKIYNNLDGKNLIKNIFTCLSTYQVLIDIGGIFINYNIAKFIEEYKVTINRKKYIVYFDNGRKIKNLDTDQFETEKSIIPSENNTFYFFSNKDITGVDAKDIMNRNVHALVVITNNTNMRDFSQGIFRLRRLLENEHETFDIVFDALFNKNVAEQPQQLPFTPPRRGKQYEQQPQSKRPPPPPPKRPPPLRPSAPPPPPPALVIALNEQPRPPPLHIESLDMLTENTTDCFKLTINIREYIIKCLTKHQNIIDTQKKKNLTKQNIFGLIKQKTNDSEDINLFIDPTFTDYTTSSADFDALKLSIDPLYIEDLNKHKININDYKFNINNYNILNIATGKANLLYELILEYFLLVISDQNISEITINTTTQIEEDTILVTIKETERHNNYSGIINPYFKYKNIIQSNRILCLYKHEETLLENINRYDMLLIYDNTNNTLIILSIDQLIRFLMYNNNTEIYSFISLNNNNLYGKSIEENFKIYLISQASEIFKKINNINNKYLNKLLLYLSINDNDKYKQQNNDKLLTLNFMNSYIHKNLYYTKYIKYKNKYLTLIKENL